MLETPQRFTITLSSWARLALVVALGYAVFQMWEMILVIVAAIVISAAIDPILRWAKRHSIPRILMVIFVYALTAVALSFFFYFLLLPLIDQFSSFIKTLTIYTNSVANESALSSLFQSQHVFGGFQSPALMEELSSYLNSFANFLSQGVLSTASMVFGGALNLILIVVLSFYLSVQEDGVGKFLRTIVPLQYENYAVNLWHRSKMKIGYWMQGQMVLGLLVAVLVFIGLSIIGVPNALLIAVLAGIFELIPLFGPILASLPAIFTAYNSLGGEQALIVAALYLVIQQLENHVFYPMVVKKVVGVPPIVSILALVVGGELGGFLGIVVAVPVAIILMEMLDDYEQRKLAKIEN